MFVQGNFPLSFTESVSFCDSLGMQIASIHNESENSLAHLACQMHQCWIGAYSHGNTPEDYEWNDGSEWDYSNWGHQQIVDWKHRDVRPCVKIYGIGPFAPYWWDAESCSTLNYPLCKWTAYNATDSHCCNHHEEQHDDYAASSVPDASINWYHRSALIEATIIVYMLTLHR